MLLDRVGEDFDGLVTGADDGKDRVRIQLKDPAVVAYAQGDAELGDEVRVRLTSADVDRRKVTFTLVD